MIALRPMARNSPPTVDRRAFGAILGGLFAGTFPWMGEAAADDLVVIAHPAVTEALDLAELAAVFTTRRRNWSGGQRIVPVNFSPGHAHRVHFDKKVLGLTPAEMAKYWIDRTIRGGASAPRHFPTASVIAGFVVKVPGAIGYVPRSAVVGSPRIILSV